MMIYVCAKKMDWFSRRRCLQFKLKGDTWKLQCDHNGIITVRRNGKEPLHSSNRSIEQVHFYGLAPSYCKVTEVGRGGRTEKVVIPHAHPHEEEVRATLTPDFLFSGERHECECPF